MSESHIQKGLLFIGGCAVIGAALFIATQYAANDSMVDSGETSVVQEGRAVELPPEGEPAITRQPDVERVKFRANPYDRSEDETYLKGLVDGANFASCRIVEGAEVIGLEKLFLTAECSPTDSSLRSPPSKSLNAIPAQYHGYYSDDCYNEGQSNPINVSADGIGFWEQFLDPSDIRDDGNGTVLINGFIADGTGETVEPQRWFVSLTKMSNGNLLVNDNGDLFEMSGC